MKKPKLGKDALTLSIMTLITVLTWIGFAIYRTTIRSTITQATQEQMKPLDPKINKQTLESLKNNRSFSQEELDLVVQMPQEATQGGALNR